MEKFKKILMVLFVILMLSPFSMQAFAGNETNDGNIKIEVEADDVRWAWGVAEITATITNISGEAINNVTAQAVFDDLAPANKRGSETSKSVDVLKAGESFSFTYKATLDADEHGLNIFQKIILWFVRLFNGGYNADNDSISVITECVTKIEFGKFTAENVIQVGYDVNIQKSDSDFFDLYSNSFDLAVGIEHDVIFYAEIYSDKLPKETSVELYTKDDFIGVLYDNGEYPDIQQNDGIYSGKFTLSSDKRKLISYYAKSKGKISREYSLNFFSNITETEEKRIELLRTDIELIKSKYSDESECINNIIQYLDKHDDITYSLTNVGILVTFDFNYTIGIDISSVNTQEINESVFSYQKMRSTMLSMQNDNSSKIITLQPSYDDLKTSIFDNGAKDVASSVYNYVFSENLDNENVTIEEMKNLAEYSIVIIDGHGGNDANVGYIMAISEQPTEQKNEQYRNSNDLGSTIFDCGTYYIIAESFFEKYYSKGDLTNILLYLGTCHGGDNNVKIRDIIYSKSDKTAAILSFENEVIAAYNRELFETIFKNLCDGSSVETAYVSARDKHGERDPYNTNGNPAELILSGNREWTLKNGHTSYLNGLVVESVGASNEPLANVTVTAENDDYKITGQTDTDGNFTLKLPLGTYKISLSLDNYTSDTTTITVDENTSNLAPYLFFMKKDTSSGGNTETNTTTVTGTVTDSTTGNAISGVTVNIADKDGNVTMTTTTDENGKFSINLPTGDHQIVFLCDGYTVFGQLETIEDTSKNIDLGTIYLEADTSSGGDSGETDTASVIGAVFDSEAQKGISEVKAILYSEDTKITYTAYTDKNGDFSIKNLPAGRYTLSFEHKLYTTNQQVTFNLTQGIIFVFTEPFEFSKKITASGDCGADGDNLTWVLYADGELVINGNGEMENFSDGYASYSSAPWISYRSSIIKVTIKNGVTNIGNDAFERCNNLANVTIPDSVIRIGHYAFEDCCSITDIILPDSVASLGNRAFSGCSKLESINIPNNIEELYYTFNKCTSLANFVIPNSVTSIIGTFSGCTNLKSIVIPNSVTTIGESAFSGCKSLTKITIPNSVTTISDYAFADCTGLTNVIIPDSVKNLSGFYCCSNLTSITIPDSVTEISENAFYKCTSLTNIVIPDSVTDIGYRAFLGCTALTNIMIPNTVTRIDSSCFEDCTSLEQITLPDSIVSVGFDAFYNTAYYNDVTNWENGVLYIGKHLIIAKNSISGTYIVKSKTITIADGAFKNCDAIIDVVINTDVSSIGSGAFAGCTALTNISLPDCAIYIGGSAFSNCTSLTSIAIPNKITIINDSTFINCQSLLSVVISDSVESIGSYAFKNCTNLKELTIPASVKIDTVYGSFAGCTSIDSIIISKGTGKMTGYSFSGDSYKNTPWYISRNNPITITLEEGITEIGTCAFYDCIGITNMVIPDSVTNVYGYAFGECTSLTVLTLPSSAKISSYAFENCTAINEISISKGTGSMLNYDLSGYQYSNHNFYKNTPWYIARNNNLNITMEEGITNIGDYAFYECTGIVKMAIPNSVAIIGRNAFKGCTNIKNITIPASSVISEGAFKECISITDIIISKGNGTISYDYNSYKYSPWYEARNNNLNIILEDGITSIDRYVFCDCTGLTSIEIPDSVEIIGYYAFNNCTNLTTINLPNGLISIDNAFSGCTSLTNITIPSSVTSMDGAFCGCDNLTSVNIPYGVTRIGVCTFSSCDNLTDVYIPSSVKSIEQQAFDGCKSLLRIVIPDSVEYIGSNAFEDCINLQELTIPASAEIDSSSFFGCTAVTNIVISKGTGKMISYKDSYYPYVDNSYGRTPWYIARNNKLKIILEEGITNIGSYAFSNCTGLESIIIPNSVIDIENGAFYGCDKISDITIPTNVTSIGDNAFKLCENLTKVTVGDNVLSIGDGAFEYCENLTSVRISQKTKSIGEDAFWGCHVLTDVYYSSTEEEWKSITIGTNNEYLTNATIHYSA